MYVLDHAALTDPGTVRDLNEDSVLAEPPVFLVADGIGGHEAGEVASALVVAAFRELVERAGRESGSVDADTVAATLQAAHGRVRALRPPDAAADEVGGAGTTACGVVVLDSGGEPYWLCFNVGDSRLYRRSPGAATVTQISVDHSHVQELVDADVITVEQAEHHPSRNLLTRAIGTEEGVQPDFWMRPVVPGERLIICSDGLVEQGLTDELVAAACGPGDARDTAERLLELSLAAGAKDNVSVVVVQVLAAGASTDGTRPTPQHGGA